MSRNTLRMNRYPRRPSSVGERQIEVTASSEQATVSAQLPGFDSLSYSARFCRRCRATLQPRQGLFGSTRWRCEQCRPSMMLGAIG